MLRAMLAGCAVVLLVPVAQPARAYHFTGTFPAGDCRAMAARTPAARLWYGHFSGEREPQFSGDWRDRRTVEGCFRTQDECENWLYQWRSEYALNFWRDFCMRGWPPK